MYSDTVGWASVGSFWNKLFTWSNQIVESNSIVAEKNFVNSKCTAV